MNKCVNTLDHGCVWGIKGKDWIELNKLAQRDGFSKSCLIYFGNIMDYDTSEVYAVFRDEEKGQNYLMTI